MNDLERLNLQKMIKEHDSENNTDKIRTLKHSIKIKDEVDVLLQLKKDSKNIICLIELLETNSIDRYPVFSSLKGSRFAIRLRSSLVEQLSGTSSHTAINATSVIDSALSTTVKNVSELPKIASKSEK